MTYYVTCKAYPGEMIVESLSGQTGACLEALRRLCNLGYYGEHTLSLRQEGAPGVILKWRACLDSIEA